MIAVRNTVPLFQLLDELKFPCLEVLRTCLTHAYPWVIAPRLKTLLVLGDLLSWSQPSHFQLQPNILYPELQVLKLLQQIHPGSFVGSEWPQHIREITFSDPSQFDILPHINCLSSASNKLILQLRWNNSQLNWHQHLQRFHQHRSSNQWLSCVDELEFTYHNNHEPDCFFKSWDSLISMLEGICLHPHSKQPFVYLVPLDRKLYTQNITNETFYSLVHLMYTKQQRITIIWKEWQHRSKIKQIHSKQDMYQYLQHIIRCK
jgi:hypothetical protein